MNWNSLVMIICAVLLAFAGYKEYSRAHKARLMLRLLAVVISVAGLACIALPLTYPADQLFNNDRSAVLLTDGFNADSLNRSGKVKQFTTSAAVNKLHPAIKLLGSLDELTDSSDISSLHIYGHGLNEFELSQLNHLPVIFHPSQISDGITAINWNHELKTGEELKIQGVYKNSSSKKVKLTLNGFGTGLDSVFIAPNSTVSFELNTVPKNAWRSTFNLQGIAGRDILTNEPLPVQVYPLLPINVLMLPASPDFESRFLKNWLSANGNGVALRTAISKNKFSQDMINMAQLPLDQLNTQSLSKFDLVVGDLSVFKNLSSGENAALKQEVEQKGLGLIIRADSIGRAASWLQYDLQVSAIAAKDSGAVALTIAGKKIKTAPLNSPAAFIVYKNGTQPLVTGKNEQVLASVALAGTGKIVFTTLSNTFSWMLAGDKADYTANWSLLVGKAARKPPVGESWSVRTIVPVIGQPVDLQLETGDQPGNITVDGSTIAPLQNPAIPFQWRGKYWPDKTGWQSVRQDSGEEFWWFNYDRNAWRNIIAAQKIAATKKYAEENAVAGNVTKQIHQKTQISVPKIYFYILLLAGLVFLWVEARMRQKDF